MEATTLVCKRKNAQELELIPSGTMPNLAHLEMLSSAAIRRHWP